jgi:uncharacterized protein YqgQ
MKYIKTTLITLGVIATLILISQFNSKKTDEVGEVNLKTNAFVESIKQQIELIKQSDKKTFSKKLYEQTIYSINDSEKNTKISRQWAQNLRQQTEFIYHDKFIQEANYFFSKSEWPVYEISFIEQELNRLYQSKLIDNKKELNKLKAVLNEYNSDLVFITSSNQYSRTNSVSDLSAVFDVEKVKSIIQKAATMYKTNSVLKNNRVLMEQLSNVKKLMYQKHLDFLSEKIQLVENQNFIFYNGYYDYYNKVNIPLFDEINNFKSIAESLYSMNSEIWYDKVDNISYRNSTNVKDAKKFFS